MDSATGGVPDNPSTIKTTRAGDRDPYRTVTCHDGDRRDLGRQRLTVLAWKFESDAAVAGYR